MRERTDAYGVEGEDIVIKFETCVVCQRDLGYDQLLVVPGDFAAITWGHDGLVRAGIYSGAMCSAAK